MAGGEPFLRDEVDYRPPLGMIGELLGARFLDSKLQKMLIIGTKPPSGSWNPPPTPVRAARREAT